MGQAVKIDNNRYAVFSENRSKMIKNQRMQNQMVQNETIQNSFGTIKSIYSELENMTETQKREKITNVAIVNAVVKFDIPLEKLDMSNSEVQKEIYDNLLGKGAIDYNPNINEENKNSFVEKLNQSKENLLGENREEYEKLVVRKEIEKFFISNSTVSEEPEKEQRTAKRQRGTKEQENAENRFFSGNGTYSNVLKGIVKNTVKFGADVTNQALISMVEETVDNVNQKTQSIENEQYVEYDEKGLSVDNARRMFIRKANRRNRDKYDKDDMFLIFIWGAVVHPGEYKVKIGSRIYDAIKIAGGLAPNADLEKIMTTQYETLQDGQVVFIPEIKDLYEEYRDEIERIVKEYMMSNEISEPETLRKLVHKKQLSAELKKVIKEELDQREIEDLIEKRIDEITKTREFLNNAANSIKLVNKKDIEYEETNAIKTERARLQKGVNNTQNKALEEALRRLNNMSDKKEEEETVEEKAEEINTEMRELLMDLMQEKVLVASNNLPKQQSRAKVYDFYEEYGRKRRA